MELIDTQFEAPDSPLFQPRPRWVFSVRRSFSTFLVSLLATLSLILVYQYVVSPKYTFGKVFTKIQLCLEKDFEVNPSNRCKVDVRSFSENDPKIYLSFESHEPLEGLPEINLQWLRNGELLLEKARPWIDAFAIDLKYASTHIKMQKFDYLSPEWAEPGRYHVRFYLEGEFVDEAGFYVHQANIQSVFQDN